MKFTITSLSILLLLACEPSMPSHAQDSLLDTGPKKIVKTYTSITDQEGSTIQTRFPAPEGTQRVSVTDNSFAAYLRNLPLKQHGTKVLYFDGREKRNDYVHAAVIDMDTGDRDLQQCADAIMRLKAEYLFEQKAYDQIAFNFTNGFRAEYSKWRAGNRIQVKNDQVNWISGNRASESYESFRAYMNMVFAYAGTLSMEKEMNPVPLDSIQIGDVFIQGGSPGHAVIVADLAIDPETEERFFLLVQSYMPAQDMHVLNNPRDKKLSPWYSTNLLGRLVTPEWMFEADDLRRFSR